MKKFRWDKKYLYWGITAFCVIVCSISFFMILQRWDGIRTACARLMRILSPLIWGFVLAYLLGPIQRFFEARLFLPLGKKLFKKEKRIRAFGRALSIALALILTGAAVAALLWLILPQLYVSVESIVVNSPEYFKKVIAWMENLFSPSSDMEETVAGLLEDISNALNQWLRSSLLPQMESVISNLTTGLYNVVKGIVNVFVGAVISCYVMYNKELFGAHAKKLLYSLLPARRVERLLRGLSFVDKTFLNFLVGKMLDSLIIGVLCYIACLILNMPYALLVSVIVGVTNIIPVFGPFIGAIPSALIILLNSPIKSLIFIILIIVLQQFDGNILGPKILGNRTGISGFWIMFSIILGGGLFGFAGMLLGVPAFVVIYTGVKRLLAARLKKRGLPTETASYKGLDHFDPETGEPVQKTDAVPEFGEEEPPADSPEDGE